MNLINRQYINLLFNNLFYKYVDRILFYFENFFQFIILIISE